MTTSAPELSACHFAPNAGTLHRRDGTLTAMLIARYGTYAVTAQGALACIARPEEWSDQRFSDWQLIDVATLDAEAMRNLITVIEHLFNLRRGTLSADSIGPALQLAAAAVNQSLSDLAARISPGTGPAPAQ